MKYIMENHSIIFSNFMVSLKTKISIISLIFYFLSLFIDFNRNILIYKFFITIIWKISFKF